MCQDWLPEAWTAQAKATAQRNRRKAAAAAKAVRKETEMMDNSVELHAPRHAFPTKRPKSEESSKAKRSKTVASSSQPKPVASSGGTAQLPRVGPPQVPDAWAQTKTRRRKTSQISEASVVTSWRPQ